MFYAIVWRWPCWLWQGINLVLAWAYVGIRIAHSILQAVVNKIEVRFLLFLLSSLALLA